MQLHHELRRAALDGVGAGLVVAFTGGDVLPDVFRREGLEADLRNRCDALELRIVLQHHRGQHLVQPPRKRAEHFGRLPAARRLAENVAVDRDRGIRGEHRRPRQAALLQTPPAGLRLGARDALYIGARGFARQHRFIEFGISLGIVAEQQQLEAHADLRQQFAAPRAARSKIDAAVELGNHGSAKFKANPCGRDVP